MCSNGHRCENLVRAFWWACGIGGMFAFAVGVAVTAYGIIRELEW